MIDLNFLNTRQEWIVMAFPLPEPDLEQSENQLYRRWPLYNEGDSYCCPTGGEITLRFDWDTQSWELP